MQHVLAPDALRRSSRSMPPTPSSSCAAQLELRRAHRRGSRRPGTRAGARGRGCCCAPASRRTAALELRRRSTCSRRCSSSPIDSVTNWCRMPVGPRAAVARASAAHLLDALAIASPSARPAARGRAAASREAGDSPAHWRSGRPPTAARRRRCAIAATVSSASRVGLLEREARDALQLVRQLRVAVGDRVAQLVVVVACAARIGLRRRARGSKWNECSCALQCVERIFRIVKRRR